MTDDRLTNETWLVTGARGQLGVHAVAQLAAQPGVRVVALSHHDLDITVADAVDDAIATYRPDIVLNAAAYTAVDAAESDEAAAELLNGTAPGLLATALARHGGRLLHVSTDYVFDGTGTVAYSPEDPVDPRTAYGRSKLAGEIAVRAALPERVHVVRTAWLYGGPGPNFVDTMRRLERERDIVDVVDDQIGGPTYVGDLAAGLIELGRSTVPGGVLHFANAGRASWYDLARETFRLVGADPDRVHPMSSSALTRPAKRPAWSVLSIDDWIAAGLTPPRNWRDALAASLAC